MHPCPEFRWIEILFLFLYFGFGFVFGILSFFEEPHLGVLGVEDFSKGFSVDGDEFDDGGFTVVGELPGIGEDVGSTAGSGFELVRSGYSLAGGANIGRIGSVIVPEPWRGTMAVSRSYI